MCEPLHSQCLLGWMEAMKGTERQTTRARAFLLFVLPLNDTRSLDTATLSQASMSRCATRQTHSCVPLYHFQVSSNRTHRSKQAKGIGRASYRTRPPALGPHSPSVPSPLWRLALGHVLQVIGTVSLLLASIVQNTCVACHTRSLIYSPMDDLVCGCRCRRLDRGFADLSQTLLLTL